MTFHNTIHMIRGIGRDLDKAHAVQDMLLPGHGRKSLWNTGDTGDRTKSAMCDAMCHTEDRTWYKLDRTMQMIEETLVYRV